MISRIEGILEDVAEGMAEVRVEGGCTYELLVPACDASDLAMQHGQRVSFVTLHYLESQGQGSHFVPRLIGFSSREQRAFFELLTTVKGIGNRKALRAMQVSHARMAEAIAAGDAKFLATLPEIGKRTAETICVELKGKVDPFVRELGGTRPAAGTKAAPRPITAEGKLMAAARDAVEVLVQLGHSKPAARDMIERVLGREDLPADATPEALVEHALR
jgi:Holliday junction DNA helicase RuvA